MTAAAIGSTSTRGRHTRSDTSQPFVINSSRLSNAFVTETQAARAGRSRALILLLLPLDANRPRNKKGGVQSPPFR